MENTSISNNGLEKQLNKKPRKKHILRNVVLLLAVLLLFLSIISIAGMNWYIKHSTGSSIIEQYEYARDIIADSSLSDFQGNAVSVFYDSDGNEIAGNINDESTIYLNYNEIPKGVINAFVAIEDSTYWKNNGVSYSGIIRAMLGYIGVDDNSGGGSTITQQIVKLTYLSSEQSLDRKIKEIFMALEMNKKYSKEQIMEFYCNQVCFSNGIYGIESAAETYFGIPASELSVSQAAYLCAIPNRPTYYDPYTNPDNALSRRDRILSAEYRQGIIDKDTYQEAIAESLVLKKQEVKVDGYQITYAKECTIQYFMKQYSESYEAADTRLNSGGYRIHTTLDSKKQQVFQNSVDTNLAVWSTKDSETGIYELQGTAVAIDNTTGKVIAIIGGRSQIATENAYTLNRAYQSFRQPGSSIKPLIVYTPAIMKGYDAEPFRTAVEKSTNSVATSTFEAITPQYGMDFLRTMGFAGIVDIDNGLPSALGGLTNGVTTVEMASAYAALANHGSFQTPTCITSIQTIDGQELYKEAEATQVYDGDAADKMVDLMKGVFTNGTARRLEWYSASNVEVAGKTGTTNDNKDGWFCGMSSDYTLAVWVGCDTPQPMTDLEGSTYPGSIWKECMLQLLNSDK